MPYPRRHLSFYSTFFLWALGFGAIQPAIPLLPLALGVSVTLVAFAQSFSGVARMFSSFFVGGLIDKYGRKPIIMLGVAIYGISSFLVGLSQSYLEFLAFRFTSGIGLALWSTAGHVIIADITDASNRGKGVGLRNILSGLGEGIGPALGAIIASLFTIRSAFFFDAALKIPMLIIFMLFLEETGKRKLQTASGKEPTAQQGSMRDLVKSKAPLVSGYTGFSVFALRQGMLITLFPLYAKTQIGLSTAEIGVALSVITITLFIIALPGGLILDRYGRKKALVPSFAVAAVSLASVPIAMNFSQVVAVGIPFGLALGLAQVSSQTLAIDIAPPGKRGQYLGFYNASTYAGVIAGPLIAAVIADIYGYNYSFVALALVLAAASLLVKFFAQETHRKKEESKSFGA